MIKILSKNRFVNFFEIRVLHSIRRTKKELTQLFSYSNKIVCNRFIKFYIIINNNQTKCLIYKPKKFWMINCGI